MGGEWVTLEVCIPFIDFRPFDFHSSCEEISYLTSRGARCLVIHTDVGEGRKVCPQFQVDLEALLRKTLANSRFFFDGTIDLVNYTNYIVAAVLLAAEEH